MIGRARALLRLVALQASWTYERMQGIGIAVAMEPLLEPLTPYPERARAARGRSAQYFNAHPFLAGAAVGALARAELDEEPGERILRLRTALSGPLGALGDQLFWAGIVPATMGLALIAVTLGGGLGAVALCVLGYNLLRVLVTWWGLRVGLAHGLRVAHAISESWLPKAAPRAGDVAAVLVGAAVPLLAAWLLRGTGQPLRASVLVVAGAALLGALTIRRPLSAPALTIGAAVLTLLWRWSAA
ncbi:MAG TPA: PTS system mannose/fructose/sorbose family transporter subunit IID [Gemmatimonadales bacterium]|jgi:PTS system mannose-specific IID component|nr:PTS system mannose/fructose/sorbose family transporter subunit IID [Gemmatimonadales bacterium]